MQDAQRQMRFLNSRGFKQQMEDAQKQMAKATAMLESGDFKRQMEDAQRQMDDMDKEMREAFPPPAVTDNN